MADVPTSGAIDPSTFPFLLIDLHRDGATGSLKVAGPSYQKALYFRAGRILFGSSNDPRDQLGAILIESGRITPEQLNDVNAKVGPGSPLAKLLTDTGFVNQRELSEAARAKVERILSDVVAYDTGTFEFEDGVLPKGAVDLKLSTERVVVAAVRRVTDRNFVLRYIDGMEVVLRGTNDVAVPFAEIETDTSGLTHYLDGMRTLKEAASLARLEDFEAAKIACALLFLGAVERVSVVDLGEVAAAAQGVPPPEHRVPEPEPPPAPAPADDPPFMIPISEPAPFIGMESSESDDEPFRIASEEPPVVLMEPEPTVVMRPEPTLVMAPEPPRAEPAAFVPPPDVPPPTVAPPARRQYDVPAASPSNAAPAPAPLPAVGIPATSRPGQEDGAAPAPTLNSWSEGSAGLDQAVAAAASRNMPRSSAGKPSTGARNPRRSGPSRAPLLLGVGAALAVAAAASFLVLRPRGEAAEARVAASAPAPAAPAGAPPTAEPPSESAAPPPASDPVTPSDPATDARALLQNGSYPEAARLFAAELMAAGRGAATVQLLVACSTETVQKAVENVGAMEIVIVPHRFQGRDCYRLCWGVYPSTQQAAAAVRTLPAYFRERGASPKVMRATEIAP